MAGFSLNARPWPSVCPYSTMMEVRKAPPFLSLSLPDAPLYYSTVHGLAKHEERKRSRAAADKAAAAAAAASTGDLSVSHKQQDKQGPQPRDYARAHSEHRRIRLQRQTLPARLGRTTRNGRSSPAESPTVAVVAVAAASPMVSADRGHASDRHRADDDDVRD